MVGKASLQKRAQKRRKEEGLVIRRLQEDIEHERENGALVRIHMCKPGNRSLLLSTQEEIVGALKG